MEKIDNDNCLGMCQEEGCSNPYEYYEKIKINGLVIFVSLCEEHSIDWDLKKMEAMDRHRASNRVAEDEKVKDFFKTEDEKDGRVHSK